MASVVIDTNIIVAAVRSSQGASARILELVDSGLFQINISVALALEYESVLKRDEFHDIITQDEATELVGFLCASSRRCNNLVRWRPLALDARDEMVAELAINSSSDYLITHNLRHFPTLDAFGVRVVTPGRFLGILRGRP
jgi:putative PIN family toxin of toxin-antitoxin system